MTRWLLRKFGFVRINHGFACGRHWVSIDGKVLAQTAGDSVPLRDGDVVRIGRACAPGCEWGPPFGQCARCGGAINGNGFCGEACELLAAKELGP